MRLVPILKKAGRGRRLVLSAGFLGVAMWGLSPWGSGLAGASEGGVDDGYKLGEGMAWIQRWAVKLWYAGEAENWALAGFYLHELEEFAEEIVGEQPVEEGHQIAPLVETMLLPQIEVLEGAVDAGEAAGFRRAYEAMIVSCNACHEATEHGFLKMAIPEGAPPPGQQFAP